MERMKGNNLRRRIAELIDPTIRQDTAPPIVIKDAIVIYKESDKTRREFGGKGTKTMLKDEAVFVGVTLPPESTIIYPPDRH